MKLTSFTTLSCLAVSGALALASPEHQKLSEVLDALRKRGVPILYSSRLVRPDMLVRSEPPLGVSKQTLDELLAPYGLEVQPGPGGALMIVKKPVSLPATTPPEAPPAPAAKTSANPPPSLSFSERVEVSATKSLRILERDRWVLDGDALADVPGTVGNAFRALDTLPGVSGTSELGGSLSVRGAPPQSNLVVLDGVEVYQPTRLFGVSSAFSPRVVDVFELDKGGFGVQYGDRTSSVLEVTSKAGSRDDVLRGVFDLNVLESSLTLDGKLPGGKGSWLVSGRGTYYQLGVESVLDGDFPSFGELHTKWEMELRPGHALSFTGVVADEDTSFRPTRLDVHDMDPEDYSIDHEGRSSLLALSYDATFGNGAALRTTVSRHRFDDRLDVAGELISGTRVSSAGELARRLSFSRGVEGQDWALRQRLELAPRSGHRLEAGYELHALDTRWRYRVGDTRSNGRPAGATLSAQSQVLPGSALPSTLSSELPATRWGAYLRDRFAPTAKLQLDLGLRLDRSDVNDATSVSPRARVSYALNATSDLFGSIGSFSQSPGYEKLFLARDFVDLSDDAERTGLANERAFALELGLAHRFRPGAQVRAEAYYRRQSGVLTGRLETEDERRARIDRYDFPAALRDQIPFDPAVTVRPSTDGRGSAYGLELLVASDPPEGRLSGWVSYAYARSRQRRWGQRFPSDFDRPHAAAAVVSYELSPSMVVSTTGRWTSGAPRTAALGARVAATSSGDSLVPERDASGALVFTQDFGTVANWNRARQPAFARLDLRFDYRTGGGKGRWLFYFEVLNVLNRKNTFFVDPTIDPGRGAPIIVEDPQQSIPRLPLFGLRFRF